MITSFFYFEMFCTYYVVFIISIYETDLKMTNNNNNNQNRKNDSPSSYKRSNHNVRRSPVDDDDIKLLQLKRPVITKNHQLTENLLFHMQVSNIFCLLFFMH